jgi:hypothetical protein
MKRVAPVVLLIFIICGSRLGAQDLVGLSHKQVLEYWQKKVPAGQISDNGDLIVINGTTFCNFVKKICTEYTTTISATELEKYKADLNANKELKYDEKAQTWTNPVKKITWKFNKVGESEYELSCMKL